MTIRTSRVRPKPAETNREDLPKLRRRQFGRAGFRRAASRRRDFEGRTTRRRGRDYYIGGGFWAEYGCNNGNLGVMLTNSRVGGKRGSRSTHYSKFIPAEKGGERDVGVPTLHVV